MDIKCGIIGLPNVGKSTLFNCLTNANVLQENYPFCTIKPNVGIVQIPDNRLQKLSKILNKPMLKAVIQFVDIAGLVKGASNGEGLGNQFLANIKNCHAIIQVVRCFENENISHVDKTINPIRDIETIKLELQLKDLETIEKWIHKFSLKVKSGNKTDKIRLSLLKKIYQVVNKGKNVQQVKWNEAEKNTINEMNLLSAKPMLYVCNIAEQFINKKNPFVENIKNYLLTETPILLSLPLQVEREISVLKNQEEKQFFLNEFGLKELGIKPIIHAAYKLLNLETFFTIGDKVVQAWAFKTGQNALQCGGIIHTDFAKGFIKVEVIKYYDFTNFGSRQACREKGKISVEGKNYIVKDGDILHFRFNV